MSTNPGSKKRSAPDAEPALSRDALMDSLPYVDPSNEDYEQYALALIEAEMQTMKPKALKELPPVRFRTPLMEKEYQRFVAADGKPEPIDVSQFLSTASAPSGKSQENWKDSVQKARSEYEAERLRSVVLEAKKDAGAALLWKGFNGNLDKDLETINQVLKEQKGLVEQINLQRNEDQQKAGKQLYILTTQYQAALDRRFRLRQATAALDQEVKELL